MQVRLELRAGTMERRNDQVESNARADGCLVTRAILPRLAPVAARTKLCVQLPLRYRFMGVAPMTAVWRLVRGAEVSGGGLSGTMESMGKRVYAPVWVGLCP